MLDCQRQMFLKLILLAIVEFESEYQIDEKVSKMLSADGGHAD